MRKRYRVLLLAAIVAALVVPVGFALSLETTSSGYAPAVATPPAALASSIILKPVPREPETTPFVHPVPDSAKLLLVGTALFGLAAAVRRAI